MYKVVYFDHAFESDDFFRYMNFSDETFSDKESAEAYVSLIRKFVDFAFIVASDYHCGVYKIV